MSLRPLVQVPAAFREGWPNPPEAEQEQLRCVCLKSFARGHGEPDAVPGDVLTLAKNRAKHLEALQHVSILRPGDVVRFADGEVRE